MADTPPARSPRAQRDRWAVNHFLGHEIWNEVRDSTRLKWDGAWNINVVTLDLSWANDGETYYRRADEDYPVPIKYHTYTGLPGRSEYLRGNPETDFGLHTITETNLSLYPFTSNNLMVTAELSEQRSGGASGFIRVPSPPDMVDTIRGEIDEINGMRFQRASRLLENRFATGQSTLPEHVMDEARHIHVRYGPIPEPTRFLDMTMAVLEWAERTSRAFPGV